MKADHGEDKEHQDGRLQDGEDKDTAVAEDGQTGREPQIWSKDTALPCHLSYLE